MIRPVRYLIITTLLLYSRCCNAQEVKDDLPLSNIEINELLNLIDTVAAKGNNNYHLLFKEGFNEQTKFVEVWINDKLGETMFMNSLSICEFYPFKGGYVFIYLMKECFTDIPGHLLRKSKEPYSYVEESPFYTESGLYKNILIEKKDSTNYYYNLELLNEEEIFNEILNGLEDLY